MRTVVAVYEAGGKGKSATIRALAQELLLAYPAYQVVVGKVPVPTKADFTLVVTINGKRVGIASQGDPGTNLQARLMDLADKEHCDIIVCASRTKGETVYAVDYLYNHRQFQTIWTSTYRIASQAGQHIANSVKGKNILTLLQALGII